uniref:Uncharacterized protein n=1 Tax=Cyclopterus lumpus TaxID=8103 RepID=A0A8C2XGR6_CYCLU
MPGEESREGLRGHSHICVPCNLGTRGTEEGRRVIAEQAGQGPMWTSCPSETLTGSVSPLPPRLITSLIFINSWGFFMPSQLWGQCKTNPCCLARKHL